MKIGIFGDSFGEEHKKNPSMSWWEYVSQYHSVTNFSVGGSDLYYSIKQLGKHQFEFDKIIWFVTNENRIQIMLDDIFDDKIHRFITTTEHAATYLEYYSKSNNVNSKFAIDALTSAMSYFNYICDIDKNSYIARLMIQDVIQANKNKILAIPCFESACNILNLQTSLSEIAYQETIAMGKDLSITLTGDTTDIRNNHITSENNKILGEKILDWINGGTFGLNEKDFVIPSIEENKKYFI